MSRPRQFCCCCLKTTTTYRTCRPQPGQAWHLCADRDACLERITTSDAYMRRDAYEAEFNRWLPEGVPAFDRVQDLLRRSQELARQAAAMYLEYEHASEAFGAAADAAAEAGDFVLLDLLGMEYDG